MSRYIDCKKCGWSKVFDSHFNVCSRCSSKSSVVKEPEVKEEELVECYSCGEEFNDNKGSHTGYGFFCDKCAHEDEEDRVNEEDKVVDELDIAIKNDETKLRYDLIPPDVLEAYAKVLTFGANKYSARNWEKGFVYSRVFAALMRHMWAWWGGENRDPESGMSHLNHAIFNIGALIYFDANYKGQDDRPYE